MRVDCSDGDDVGPPNDTDLISVTISATGLAGVVTVAMIALLLILGAIWWARKGKIQNLNGAKFDFEGMPKYVILREDWVKFN